VFSTKNRIPSLIELNRTELYKYIWGVLNQKKCHLYRIGGVSDHVHIVTHVHPTVALANLIKDIKLASSGFIKVTVFSLNSKHGRMVMERLRIQ
jgi:REP element-mobilizing transposase RayT